MQGAISMMTLSLASTELEMNARNKLHVNIVKDILTVLLYHKKPPNMFTMASHSLLLV